ncbi:uncharacterized protein LOC124420597 [Lucilia cuprina]|uniref:uncharacterized protein LOC124420597 n=1 Tax=Lucilia cuprina TaxID=7375 RepID=UPI001F06A07F|nr:uncharacterized protein LOC124420597 [Lucilia cuprina]
MVVCWLCHECCHFKCSGLSGLVSEAVSKNKGLHWCCESCRKFGVNYYRFFQETKKKFAEIQDEAVKLNERISAYGKLFDDFKSLDNLKSTPQSSPKRRKSARNLTKEKRDDQPTVSAPPCNTASDPNVPLTNISVSVPSCNTASDLTVPISNITELSSNNSHLSYADAVLRSANVTTNVTNPIVDNPLQLINTEIIPLRAIPPKKTIFISRLASDTTSDSVDFYIKNKLGNDADISIQKFNFSQPRSISSFKITVSMNHFERLLDPNFWPINTLVREYIYRSRPQTIAALPQRESFIPKN